MLIRELAQSERPAARAAAVGVGFLSNAELLALVIRGDDGLDRANRVRYRYPDDDVLKGKLPGPVDPYYLRPYEWQPVRPVLPDLITILSAIDCYEYQSSENPRWIVSDARELCVQLRAALVRRLPGYDKAPWEWERRTVVGVATKARGL